jgi:hypothetical protein
MSSLRHIPENAVVPVFIDDLFSQIRTKTERARIYAESANTEGKAKHFYFEEFAYFILLEAISESSVMSKSLEREIVSLGESF